MVFNFPSPFAVPSFLCVRLLPDKPTPALCSLTVYIEKGDFTVAGHRGKAEEESGKAEHGVKQIGLKKGGRKKQDRRKRRIKASAGREEEGTEQ